MKLRFTPPEPVLEAIFRLTAAGHEAYLVGGCVRDLLLCREPADWDVCTSAHPNQVKSLFPGALETGLKHGTVTALFRLDTQSRRASRFPVEITTFRAESGYGDHRHPDVVRFCSDLATDLARRDFTINAMAWSPQTGLVDLFGGQLDLAERLVRCVGDPLHRFSEDALRMLRAIRFCSQLDFSLDPDTQQAILHHRNDILHISLERVQYEMTRTLTGRTPSKAALWWETGLHTLLFDTLLPALSPMSSMPADMPHERLSALQRLDAGAPDTHTSPSADTPVSPSADTPVSPFADAQASPSSDAQASPTSEVIGWALVLSAGGLTLHTDRLIPWMRRLRFPKARMMAVLKLIHLIFDDAPPTLRNQTLAVSLYGKAWVATALRLRRALSGASIPDNPPPPDTVALSDATPLSDATARLDATALPDGIPLPDGGEIAKLLDDGWIPQGMAFGTFLACLRIARCEQPLLTGTALPSSLVRAMRDAASRCKNGSVQSQD